MELSSKECGLKSYNFFFNILSSSPEKMSAVIALSFPSHTHTDIDTDMNTILLSIFLQSVDPKQYPKKKMEKRFVFNKIEVRSKVEFESAEFPNWYISTSQAEHKPVFLGSNNGQDIVDFTMEPVSS